MSSARLEFPLAQGWSRGLSIGFEDIESSAKLDMSQFISVKQVHGTRIHEPTYQETKIGGLLPIEADGLCWNSGQILDSSKGLLVKSADCAPLVYVHRLEERVAIVHAGWRGLQQGMHLEPFRSGGFAPRDTWVWLGPCLNGKLFEVDEDMWSQFAERGDHEIFERAPELAPTRRYFYPWRKIANDFAELGVELLYNVEVNTGQDLAFASWRRCKAQGLSKIPQQNYSWVRRIA